MSENGNMTRDQLEVMLNETKQRKESYAQANIDQDSLITALRVEVERRDIEIQRLDRELSAERLNNQLLGNHKSETQNGLVAEVQYLRELCIANGINPNR